MILMIDNYDSFTYNLVQYLREMAAEVQVFRNDAITVAEIEKLAPAAIVISPGPGRPEDAGDRVSRAVEGDVAADAPDRIARERHVGEKFAQIQPARGDPGARTDGVFPRVHLDR